ncbi:MAG: hypothetical protein U0136_12400 [Bdellovibrionota bacterium]
MWTDENAREAGDQAPSHRHDGPKQPEQLKVSSGQVMVIDHFMLANQQFLSALPQQDQGTPEEWVRAGAKEIRLAVERYGGALLQVEAGDWGVNRDPQATAFTLGRFGGDPSGETERSAMLEARGNATPIGRVFIDTRCVVFVDAGILANRPLLDDYRRMRQEGEDKAARDLIRENGAAVRYGFNRDGDELGVFRLPDDLGYALWPDVVESLPPGSAHDTGE